MGSAREARSDAKRRETLDVSMKKSDFVEIRLFARSAKKGRREAGARSALSAKIKITLFKVRILRTFCQNDKCAEKSEP